MKKSLMYLLIFGGLTFGAARESAASFVDVPLHCGMLNEVRNEFDALLPGTAHTPGALVQIMQAPEGIFPPDKQGNPHPLNPVLGTFRIGEGTDPAMGAIGRASGSIIINRYQAQPIFARIFNQTTGEESSFYTDSPIYVNSVNSYDMFMIDATRTLTPLDADDDDGDGLNNSWEKSIGTDALNPDSDGDGIGDYEEFLAGTNPLDAGSFLSLVEMVAQSDGSMMMMWASVEGKVYQLQATTNQLTDIAIDYENLNGPVAAFGNTASIVVTGGQLGDYKHFRVKLVE